MNYYLTAPNTLPYLQVQCKLITVQSPHKCLITRCRLCSQSINFVFFSLLASVKQQDALVVVCVTVIDIRPAQPSKKQFVN